MTVDRSATEAGSLVPRETVWLLCPPRDFDVRVLTVAPDCAVVALTGEVDARSVALFRDAVASALAGGAARMVIDLSAATRIDTTGLGVIVLAARRLEPSDVSVVIAHAGLARTLRACGLDRLLSVHESRDEALRSAGASAARQARAHRQLTATRKGTFW